MKFGEGCVEIIYLQLASSQIKGTFPERRVGLV